MAQHLVVDGNNLLYAMYDHAPMPHIGRETLVRVLERWAHGRQTRVTLVFDGADPGGALGKQMRSARLDVRFSAPYTADDVIVAMVHQSRDPGRLWVISGDKAIRSEAVARRCQHTSAVEFVAELFPPTERHGPITTRPPKPRPEGSTSDWLETFGYRADDHEPFEGHDAMLG